MSTYVRSAQTTDCDVIDLHVWNGRISKALLEDIAHVEVLLRNFISERLAKACGHEDWYRDDAKFRFNSSKTRRFETSVTEIERQIRHSGKPVTPGHVNRRHVARLMVFPALLQIGTDRVESFA
ncbi:Abi family protein [Bifidobacterium aesculapii]|uniref:Abi family protein n=1 Tax=Bifidobacterium aesculapii TaxID=1329411 RepID=UPI0006E29247|nr:Abi family protein [Bifidobacterium aesculapii]